MKHKWKTTDDIAAFYLYKYGSNIDIEIVSKKLGIKLDSMKMRIQNFRYLDRNKGLRKYSKQTELIFLSKNGLNKIELKAELELVLF